MNYIRIGDMTFTDLDTFEVYNRKTGLLDYTLDDLQNITIEGSQEKSPITGKGGRTIGYKKKNKSIKGNGTSGLVSAGLLKSQTGGNIRTGELTIKKSEEKTIVAPNAAIVTDAVALGIVGAEIGEIQLFDKDGYLVAKYAQGTTASADKFAYNPKTKEITLPTDSMIQAEMNILYAYTRTIDGECVNDPSDKYSETAEIWLYGFGTDPCDNTYYAGVHIPRADFDGDFSLPFGEDQTTHNFSFEGLPDYCNKNAGSDLFKIYIYRSEDGMKGSSSRASEFATASEVQAVFS